MEFKMPSKSLILGIFLFSLVIGTMAKDCFTECGSVKGYDERLKNGEKICGKNATKTGYWVLDPCHVDCGMHEGEFTKEENQLECFCNHCKDNPQHLHDYCEKPSPSSKQVKSTEDCKMVCDGEAKHYGLFCRFDK